MTKPTLTPELRAIAAQVAQAHPLDGKPAIAKGNHLVAQNDEPEPVFSEEALIEADVLYNARKNSGQLQRERDERAAWDEMQRKGWGPK